MLWRVCFCMASLMPAADSPPAPLEQVLTHIAGSVSKIPNYTCLETVERSRTGEPCADCEIRDRFRVEVLIAGTRELVTWPGESRFYSTVSDLVQTGATFAGHFAGFASSVFVDGHASHFYRGQQKIRSRRVLRYDYEFAKPWSDLRIKVNGLSAIVTYRGSWFIEPQNLDLARLTVTTERIPGWLGITAVESTIDYERVPIGGASFLLPRMAISTARYASGSVDASTTRYSECRQYTATSNIRFDAVEPGVNHLPATRAGASLPPLPADIKLDTRLEHDLDLEDRAAGDPIRLSLAGEVDRGGLRLARSAAVHARITRLEVRKRGRSNAIVLALRPLFLELGGARIPLRLKLTASKLRNGSAGILPADDGEGVLVFNSKPRWVLKYSHFYWETIPPLDAHQAVEH